MKMSGCVSGRGQTFLCESLMDMVSNCPAVAVTLSMRGNFPLGRAMLATVAEGEAATAAWGNDDRPWWWHLPRKTQLEDLFDCTSRGVGVWGETGAVG